MDKLLNWIGIPIYVAFVGQFPFNLNARVAAIGSLILKIFEFGAMAKLQGASHLDEHSIAMTQKMDKVSVPIKIRAILRGFATGYNDRYHGHDNSFWISFGGTPQAVVYVQLWLCLCMITTVRPKV